MPRKIIAADLFCGGGGSSTGLSAACKKMGAELELVAINHWDIAINTHTKNHPNVRHICGAINTIRPAEIFPNGRINLLVASPECTHHSNARGGKPMSDQKRSTAWDILPWLQHLYVENILIENVKEFRNWGPLGANGRPLKSKRGETYKAFILSLESLGYNVGERVLNAADYGDPTTRERLFIIGRRGNKKIIWPVPSHSQEPKADMFQGAKSKWRSAREIIDWDIESKSIFTRKKPLAPATLRRIEAGLRKFGGPNAEPFIVILRRHADAQSVEQPIPTVTGSGSHHALCEPFIMPLNHGEGDHRSYSMDKPMPGITTVDAWSLVTPFVIGQQSGATPRSVDNPIPTVSTDGAIALVEPFIVPQFSESGPKSVDDPLGTMTTTSRGIGLCEPYLVEVGGPAGRSRNPGDIDKPMRTLIGENHTGLVEPFIVPFFGERDGQQPRSKSVDEPMPTVTGQGAGALVEPIIITTDRALNNRSKARSIHEPIATITSVERMGIVEPCLVPYYGASDGSSIEEPVPTVTTKDRFGLVEPYLIQYNGQSEEKPLDQPVPSLTTREKFALIEPQQQGYRIDIRFRMLQPHELSAAMGFPKDYEFEGNREAVVKQIGNAVAVNLAEALCTQLLTV